MCTIAADVEHIGSRCGWDEGKPGFAICPCGEVAAAYRLIHRSVGGIPGAVHFLIPVNLLELCSQVFIA